MYHRLLQYAIFIIIDSIIIVLGIGHFVGMISQAIQRFINCIKFRKNMICIQRLFHTQQTISDTDFP
jgi:hypothetical protein